MENDHARDIAPGENTPPPHNNPSEAVDHPAHRADGHPAKKASPWGKILKYALPLAVSVALCYTLFRDVDMAEMMRIIREDCNFWIIGLELLIGVLPILIRARRWGIQLRAIKVTPPFRVLFYSIFGTYSFNILFPRFGEVWRCGYIAYRQDAPFSGVFGSMIADRMADTLAVGLITLATFLCASSYFLDFVRAYPHIYSTIVDIIGSPIFWVACAGVFWGLYAIMKFGHNRYIEKIRNFIKGIWSGFAAIARMEGKGEWLLLTFALWGCYFLQFYVAFYAFPGTRQLLTDNGIVVAIICYVLTSISMALPSQGGIGPYQVALLFGLTLFAPEAVRAGADPAAADAFRTAGVAFGNTLIAAQTIFWIVGGILIFILIAADKRRNKKKIT